MPRKHYDFLIVGAGPAGMFAVYELLKKKRKPTIALIDSGNRIEKRKRTEVMAGFGGAGTYSDGKLHYTPVLSHNKALNLMNIHEYSKIIEYTDKIFTEFGVDDPYYPKSTETTQRLVENAQKHDVKLYVRKNRHVGTDKLVKIIKKVQDYFEANKVAILDNVEVEDVIIENGKCAGVKTKGHGNIKAGKTLLAPGRIGARWLQGLCEKYDVGFLYDKIEVGVRVEFPESVMREYSDELYETVFEMRTKQFDDIIRTFCPCPRGLVAIEDYKGYVCVNGHTNSDMKSENSNFAFVTEIELTEPLENTTIYAESIARLTNTLGGGKPILQRLSDLKAGRRSTWGRINKSYVVPSLKDVTPGDITMALPYRVVSNIIEGLDRLSKVMPGLNNGSTLLYAPEVKYRGSKVTTNSRLETKIKNLFVAGDGAGVSGNIVGAAATGIIAARGMAR